MALRTADDGVNACDEFVLVERLCHVVVGTKAEALDLVLDSREAERMRIGVLTFATRSVLSTS